jgi:hypothetical protein
MSSRFPVSSEKKLELHALKGVASRQGSLLLYYAPQPVLKGGIEGQLPVKERISR